VARYRDRLLANAQVEQRVIGGVPWRPWDSWQWRFDTGGPPHPSRQVMGVDAALGLPALYAAVKLIADNIASMPLRVYLQQLGRDGYPGKRLWTGPSLFDMPAYNTTMYEWVNVAMICALLQGNAWGFITGRDAYGYPTGIQWLPPQDVYVHEAEDENSWNPLAAKVFMFGREVKWHGPDAEVFHFKGMPMGGRLEGISPLRYFALMFTSGTEAMRFGNDWFAAGGFPSGTFQNAEIEVDKQQAAEMRAELVKSLRRHEPLVYGRDWDYKPVTVPPAEAQFLESIQMNATQVAAVYNVPPDRIGGTRGDSLTYNTTEQSTLQIIEACRPWLVNMEQRFSMFLLPRNRMCKFYTDALLKTDLEARMTIYQIMRNIGLRSVNELRDLEDLPPLTGKHALIGDEYLPLTTMNAMGTRAGVIPKSFINAVEFEMDRAADKLIQLEKYIIPSLVKQGYPVQGVAPVPGAGGGAGGGGGGGSFGGSSGTSAPGGTSAGSTGPNPAQVTVNGRTGIPIGRPNAPLPLAQDPASFLASLISVQRNSDVPYEIRIAAQEFLIAVAGTEERVRHEDPDINDDYSDGLANGIVPGLTTFIPHRDEVRDQIHSLNGKGRGHL
jgi:HK97 family phage portal protein